MNRIISVVGTRPNFIKVDPDLDQDILHTGQHYDGNMSEIFFQELGISKPKWNLNCPNESFGDMITGLFKVLKEEKPSLIIVYGDTNSSLAGAVAGFQLRIPVAHVEAGLRSRDMTMIEENNRIMIDHTARFNYVPTLNALYNLQKEGIFTGNLVGDVMYDRILRSTLRPEDKKNYLLLTLHRRENIEDEEIVKKIFAALGKVDYRIIFVCHPHTRKNLVKFKIEIPKNIIVREPVGYFEMLKLEMEALKILTDSGGIQKEAMFVKTPCFTLRDSTEWPETISAGWNVICNPKVNSAEELSDVINDWKFEGRDSHPFGSGNAWEKIREHLQRNGYLG